MFMSLSADTHATSLLSMTQVQHCCPRPCRLQCRCRCVSQPHVNTSDLFRAGLQVTVLLRPKYLHTQCRPQVRPCQLAGPAVVGPNPPSWLLRAVVASHPPKWLLRAAVAFQIPSWLLRAAAGSHPPRWLQGAVAPWMANPRWSRRREQRAPAPTHPALPLLRT